MTEETEHIHDLNDSWNIVIAPVPLKDGTVELRVFFPGIDASQACAILTDVLASLTQRLASESDEHQPTAGDEGQDETE